MSDFWAVGAVGGRSGAERLATAAPETFALGPKISVQSQKEAPPFAPALNMDVFVGAC